MKTDKIITEENTFKSDDGLTLFWRKWLPRETKGQDRKATVMVVHGVNEHSGRYWNVADFVVPENIPMYAIDHRGHGKSEGIRSYVDSFIEYINDLRKFFLDIVSKEAEGKPIFILGHSMGSIITMNYVSMYQEGLKGMILSGSGSKNSVSPFLKFLAVILSRIAPKVSRELPFPEDWITRDKEEIKKVDEDPLCLDGITFRLGAEMNKWLKLGVKNADRINIPTLIQRGEKDVSFVGTEELLKRINTKDKILKVYDNCRHEIYNELMEDRKIILTDLVNWLNYHI